MRLKTDRNYRHGFTRNRQKAPEYNVWNAMLSRCIRPNSEKFDSYGGRGIAVCERWLDFSNFITDMGLRPTPSHQLERKDNDGNYEPSNCRWATRKEQARNRRDNHFLEFQGVKATIAEWAERTNLGYDNIKNRINNLGWSVEEALTTPIKKVCQR